MRTVHRSGRCEGVSVRVGGCLPRRVSAPVHAGIHIPHYGQNSWHALVKTLPFRNYVKSVRIRQEQINYRKTSLPCNLLEEVILLWLYLCLALLLLLCRPLLSWWNACWWFITGIPANFSTLWVTKISVYTCPISRPVLSF